VQDRIVRVLHVKILPAGGTRAFYSTSDQL